MDNVKIEVVDIWHFIMSYILMDYEKPEEAVKVFLWICS